MISANKLINSKSGQTHRSAPTGAQDNMSAFRPGRDG